MCVKPFLWLSTVLIIVNNIVRGGKEPAYAFVPYGMLESNGREDFREAGSYLVYEDVEQAKEILKKAGYGKNRPLPQIYDFV